MNFVLLCCVCVENFGVVLIYKFYLDVEVGLCFGQIVDVDLCELVDIVVWYISVVVLMVQVDVLWIMILIMGFEVLMCGVLVIVLGVLFYVGWGLMCDFGCVFEWCWVQVDLVWLIYVVLIDYFCYFDLVSCLFCLLEVVLEWLVDLVFMVWGGLFNCLLVKVQGLLLGYLWLWWCQVCCQ